MPADRLLTYLEIKVHHLIQDRVWGEIRIVGGYDRSRVISDLEKDDKAFNWQRPTASVEGDCLTLHCYPGRDYVLHYGLIVATYLSMRGHIACRVTVEEPAEMVCAEAVDALLLDAADVELVIVGWGLDAFTSLDGWVKGNGFSRKRDMLAGQPVLYLGYLHSIWGDVAGRVVTRLAELGAKRVLYVGKVGSLEPEVEPNEFLATGNSSILEGDTVSWTDFFGSDLQNSDGVIHGLHISSPSILLEDKDWLAGLTHGMFVDPEIGWMGLAAEQAGIEYGYLHVISNNLARERDEDLSNERLSSTVQRRRVLRERIRKSVEERLRAICEPERVIHA